MDVSGNEDYTSEQTQESIVYNIVDSVDYSSYFENLQTIGIVIIALLVSYGIAFAFFKGLRK